MTTRIIRLLIILIGINNCLLGQKSYEDSLKNVIAVKNELIKLNPKDNRAFLQKANAEFYLSSTKFNGNLSDEAIKDYNKAIELNPNNDTAFNDRGIYYQTFEMDSLAIIDFTMCISINPKFSEAYYNRGLSFYTHFRDYNHAIDDFTTAIKLNNNFADAYNFRAYAYFFSGGKTQQYCSDWEKAYKLDVSTAKKNLEKYCK
jgi:tetratricopeptide (TPR) repeat protein